MFMPATPALAQDWGPDGKPDVVIEKELPSEESLASAASDVLESRQRLRGLTRREKRDLGLTIPAMLRTLAKIHADGDLEGMGNDAIAADILSRSAAANPKAFMDVNNSVGIDEDFWQRALEWIEKLLPVLLMIIALFS
jgi:hypothetical protein